MPHTMFHESVFDNWKKTSQPFLRNLQKSWRLLASPPLKTAQISLMHWCISFSHLHGDCKCSCNYKIWLEKWKHIWIVFPFSAKSRKYASRWQITSTSPLLNATYLCYFQRTPTEKHQTTKPNQTFNTSQNIGYKKLFFFGDNHSNQFFFWWQSFKSV